MSPIFINVLATFINKNIKSMKFGEHDPSQPREFFVADNDVTVPLTEKGGRSLDIGDIEEDVYDRADAINTLVENLHALREAEGPVSQNVDLLEKQLMGIKKEMGGYLSTVIKEGHNTALREDIEGILQKISKAIGTIQ